MKKTCADNLNGVVVMRAVIDIGTNQITMIFGDRKQTFLITIPTTISFVRGIPLVGNDFEGEGETLPELQVKHIFDYIASPDNKWTFYGKDYEFNDFVLEISKHISKSTNECTFDEVVIVEPDHYIYYNNNVALLKMSECLILCNKKIPMKRSEVVSKYYSYPSKGTKSIVIEFTHHSTNFIYNVDNVHEYLIECRYINAENWEAYMRDYALEILSKKTGKTKKNISNRMGENELKEFITNLERNANTKHYHIESIGADFDASIDECFSGSPIHNIMSTKIKQLLSKYEFDNKIPIYVYGDGPLRPGIKETIHNSIPNHNVEVFYVQEYEHDTNENSLLIAKAAWEVGFDD